MKNNSVLGPDLNTLLWSYNRLLILAKKSVEEHEADDTAAIRELANFIATAPKYPDRVPAIFGSISMGIM
jgi:hypothetical protein